MKTTVLIVASIYGGLSVILGAFGAHALKKYLSLDQLSSFEVGVKYQMYHALALLLVGFAWDFQHPTQKYTAFFWILGTFLFSFSIYGLSTQSMWGAKLSFLGPITPMGGLLIIMGWGMLLWTVIKQG